MRKGRTLSSTRYMTIAHPVFCFIGVGETESIFPIRATHALSLLWIEGSLTPKSTLSFPHTHPLLQIYNDLRAYVTEAEEDYVRPIATRTYNSSWAMYDDHLVRKKWLVLCAFPFGLCVAGGKGRMDPRALLVD